MDTQKPSVEDELLKNQSAGTLTSTSTGAAIDLGDGYAPGFGGQPMQFNMEVTALDHTTGDETYVLTVQDSPDNSSWTTRASTTITAIGLAQCQSFIKQRYIRSVLTLAGTTPSITIHDSYFNPITLG